MQEAIQQYVVAMNFFGGFLVLATRLFRNNKGTWAMVGLVLIIIALGNAMVLAGAEITPTLDARGLFGLVVYGSLGVRLLGEWLTKDAI